MKKEKIHNLNNNTLTREHINSLTNKNYENDDPMELKGIQIAGADFDQMVENVIEEYIMLGYDDKMILWIFKNPFYKFTNNVYKLKGAKYVQQSIEKIKTKWMSHSVITSEQSERGNLVTKKGGQ